MLTVRTRHVLAGLEAVEEHERCESTSWNLAREFVWGGRFPEPVALIDHTARGASAGGTEEVLHYLHDRLGSVIGLTSASGALVERYTYDPYGKTLIERPVAGGGGSVTWTKIEQSRFGNPFAWTGQRYDPASRLYHFRFRSYDPGRDGGCCGIRWGMWMGPVCISTFRSGALAFRDPTDELAPPPEEKPGDDDDCGCC